MGKFCGEIVVVAGAHAYSRRVRWCSVPEVSSVRLILHSDTDRMDVYSTQDHDPAAFSQYGLSGRRDFNAEAAVDSTQSDVGAGIGLFHGQVRSQAFMLFISNHCGFISTWRIASVRDSFADAEPVCKGIVACSVLIDLRMSK